MCENHVRARSRDIVTLAPNVALKPGLALDVATAMLARSPSPSFRSRALGHGSKAVTGHPSVGVVGRKG